ncbi:MAG: hypothetical protein OES24_02735, partial [Acidimicrobiia bacterium]|nr:hypothetical protein [Acidimicrobiia bacterium]
MTERGVYSGGNGTGGPEERSVAELRSLDGIKWGRYEPPVLAAWVADMDLAPPALIVDALAEFVAGQDYGYNFAASDRLIGAFCNWQQNHHGWSPDPGRVRRFCDVLH